MQFKKISALIALIGAVSASTQVMAATDGDLGTKSTGDLNVSMQIDSNYIMVEKLDDIDLGTFDPAQAIGGGSDFCIFRSGSPDGFTYDLEISGKSSSGFALASITADTTIPYKVHYKESTGATSGDSVLKRGNNAGLAVQKGVGITAGSGPNGGYDCDGENVSIFVSIDSADAAIAEAANDYGDLITLVVSPSSANP